MVRRGYQRSVVLTVNDALVLAANPHVDYLIASNMGPMGVMLSFGQPSQTSAGIYLPPTADPLILTRESLGNIIGLELRGQAVQPAGLPATIATGSSGNALSGASIGAKLSFLNGFPATAQLVSATIANITGGAPTVQLQLIHGGNTIVLASTTTPLTFTAPISLGSNDTVQWNVTTLAAGSTFDATLNVLSASQQAVNNSAGLTLLVGESCGMTY